MNEEEGGEEEEEEKEDKFVENHYNAKCNNDKNRNEEIAWYLAKIRLWTERGKG